jgi:hypothetical protein
MSANTKKTVNLRFRLVLGLVVVLSAGGCVVAPGSISSPTTQPSVPSASTADPTSTAGPTLITGCETSVVTPMTDLGADTAHRRGGGSQMPLNGLSLATSDARAAYIRPLIPPLSQLTPLRASLLAPWSDSGATADTQLYLIWGPADISGLSFGGILAAGDWALTESPGQRGQDANAVRSALDGVGKAAHYQTLGVGQYDAVLVHQDAIPGAQARPYGLYWFDGTRDMAVQAVADPNSVINLARSMYCH